MFDLDVIEKDWKENSFCLSDIEIMEIYKGEGITTSKFKEEIKNAMDSIPKLSAEERLFALVFNDEEMTEKLNQIDVRTNKIYENLRQRKRYLSHSSQMKVVEGCMDVVFESTKFWYNFFNSRISIEKIYYICLEALFTAAKYCIHYSTKACFRAYVYKVIKRSIIKNIAKWEHIFYHNAYCLIENCKERLKVEEIDELKFDYDLEQPSKPSFIYEQLKNKSYDVDYVARISSEEFMAEYIQALDELTDEEKFIMNFLFDLNGEKGLTYKEIGEYLGIEPIKVSNVKRKVLKKLRNDSRFDKYRTE